MGTTDRLQRLIDESEGELLEELQNLVRIPSPYGSEKKCQETVAARMKELSLELDVFTADQRVLRKHPGYTPLRARALGGAGRPNVCGRWRGEAGGRTLILAAHIDHLPVGDRSLWSVDPFAAEIKGPKMIGRGVANDKGGVAIMLSAVNVLRKAGLRLRGDLVLLSSLGGRDYCEGDSCGLFACALRGYKADAAIYLHPHEGQAGLSKIVVSSVGATTFTIGVSGEGPKFFYEDWKGVSAIMKMTWLLRGFADECEGQNLKLNVGLISGGRRWQQGGIGRGGPILTPVRCLVECRISFDYDHRLEEVRTWIAKTVKGLASEDPWLKKNQPEVRFWHYQGDSSSVDIKHPIVRVASEAIRAVTHRKPGLEDSESPSDIRLLTRYSNTPTIKYGPLGGGGDQPDEWIDTRQYIDAVKVTCLSIVNWCGLRT